MPSVEIAHLLVHNSPHRSPFMRRFDQPPTLPVGVVAQIMGHAPSATAERHYRVRPLDLLRKWHGKLEAWILQEAGIHFEPEQAAGLRVVGRQ